MTVDCGAPLPSGAVTVTDSLVTAVGSRDLVV